MLLACLISTKKMLIDDLQMSIKCPTSEEEACEQEAAAHFDRSSFFYLSALMVETQCSAYLPVFAHNCIERRLRLLLSESKATPLKSSVVTRFFSS